MLPPVPKQEFVVRVMRWKLHRIGSMNRAAFPQDALAAVHPAG